MAGTLVNGILDYLYEHEFKEMDLYERFQLDFTQESVRNAAIQLEKQQLIEIKKPPQGFYSKSYRIESDPGPDFLGTRAKKNRIQLPPPITSGPPREKPKPTLIAVITVPGVEKVEARREKLHAYHEPMAHEQMKKSHQYGNPF